MPLIQTVLKHCTRVGLPNGYLEKLAFPLIGDYSKAFQIGFSARPCALMAIIALLIASFLGKPQCQTQMWRMAEIQLTSSLPYTTGAISLVYSASARTITRSSGSFITNGFKQGNNIIVTSTVRNNGSFTIQSVTARVITVITGNALVNETATSIIAINPLTQTLTATFTSPTSGITITRPGFWDGGTTWRIRFAPNQVGSWRYSTTFSDASNTGLQNRTGTVNCVSYTGNLDIYKHGFVRASSNGRYLTYADGTPFFYLSDSHCFMEYENYTDVFLPVLRQRVLQGFTSYRTQPGSTGQQFIGTIVNGVLTINPTNYQTLDRYYTTLADSGIVNSMGNFCRNFDYFGAAIAQIATYWCARFGAFPMLFFTAQEVDQDMIDATPADDAVAARWRPAFDAWNAADLGGHNQIATCHMWGTTITPHNSGTPMYWATDSRHDIFYLQAGHEASKVQTKNHYSAYWNAHSSNISIPVKPFIEAEANYEEIFGTVHQTQVRNAAYKSIQCGSGGFGYGAHGIWNMCTATGCMCCDIWGITPWSTAINFNGAKQMKYMVDFYKALSWWNLTPRFNDQAWATFSDQERSVLKSDGSNTYVVYFYNSTTTPGKSLGTLKSMNNTAKYQAKWFNPRTGGYTWISNNLAPTTGAWLVPNKPDSNDWVLLVKTPPVDNSPFGQLQWSTWGSGKLNYSAPNGGGTQWILATNYSLMGGTSDNIVFANAPENGGFQVDVRLDSLDQIGQSAGIMIRQNLTNNSPTIFFAHSFGAVGVWYRITTGGFAIYTSQSMFYLPVYLRVIRYGSTIRGLISNNGIHYTQITNVQFPHGQVYAGLSIDDKSVAVTSKATFSNYSIRGWDPMSPINSFILRQP